VFSSRYLALDALLNPCEHGPRQVRIRRPGSPYKLLASVLKDKRYLFRSDIALAYFALGDKDHGSEWLTQAVDEQEFPVRYLKVGPAYDDVRSDPRFKRLIARLNIPDV
jgi:hypothetical protein